MPPNLEATIPGQKKLEEVKKDQLISTENDTTLELTNKGRMIVHLFLLSLINRSSNLEKIRTSPDIKKGPDLISKTIQMNTDSGKMESQTGCNMPCRNDNCFEKCVIPDVHPSSVLHICRAGHSWK